MDKAWVDERNSQSERAFLDDLANLEALITEKLENGYDFGRRTGDTERILAEAALAGQDPSKADFQELAYATWGLFSWNDELIAEADARFGEGFAAGFSAFNPRAYDIYLDEDFPLEAGDYIVTDPCYLERHDGSGIRWWDNAFSEAMPSMHMRDTLYGDWGCSIFRLEKGEELDALPDEERIGAAYGRFCADAGEVCIVRLDEATRYNPEFAAQLAADTGDDPLGCRYAAVIENFEGRGRFEVVEEEYEYNGKPVQEYSLIIVLEGRDTASGEYRRYESRQTGF